MKKIIPKRWSNDSGYGYHIPKNGLHLFDTPYKAFANLFERISGKGTWENNPFVVAYSFKLID
nr:MAG TPA: ASCH domain protein [Caudoviricetes sp.]